MTYSIQDLKDQNLIIFEAISGSKAYGTSLPTSDTDIRGVFVQPLDDIIKYGFVDQVCDEKNDITYYELNRFFDLLSQNKADVIEFLAIPEEFIQIQTCGWKMIADHKVDFYTKICKFSFGGFAQGQIKKATGYNKKMNWEKEKIKRKTVLDFCYIIKGNGTIAFKESTLKSANYGLSKIPHGRDIYAMYDLRNWKGKKGIVKDEETSNDIQLVSIPKGVDKIYYMIFNKDAYSVHCREYREYQEWLEKRNKDRYKLNKDHGKNYDSKNMMHTFRMLYAGISLAKDPENFSSMRSEAEIKDLMQIRNGVFEYENLIELAENLIETMDECFDNSNLPDAVDKELIAQLKLEIRQPSSIT